MVQMITDYFLILNLPKTHSQKIAVTNLFKKWGRHVIYKQTRSKWIARDRLNMLVSYNRVDMCRKIIIWSFKLCSFLPSVCYNSSLKPSFTVINIWYNFNTIIVLWYYNCIIFIPHSNVCVFILLNLSKFFQLQTFCMSKHTTENRKLKSH